MTSDKIPFDWNEECEQAFSCLKQKLCCEPVLKFPDFGRPFTVEVDASNYAVGGVLSQLDDHEQLHPIAYFSTALQPSQQNWSATTKEAFALVLAVRHWHVYLAGTRFVLNSDHNPLTFLRSQKDSRGKIGRWVNELEEFDYVVQYIPGKDNLKADALSRNKTADHVQPKSHFEDKIYANFAQSDTFREQLKDAQSKDTVIHNAKLCIIKGHPIPQGRLRRVQRQLRIEHDILTKSGRPILPQSLRRLIVSEYHNFAHLGADRVHDLLKQRFYWPNMYNYIRSFTLHCQTCQKSKCDTRPAKAPLLPMFVPNAPMQFLSLDIGYLPKDASGYQYILLIGDVFSKYIDAIPLKDQTAPTIVSKLQTKWVYVHGTPFYLLTDQGSNVDGQVMHDVCVSLGIEKRRSSAYHSQGNGFAERNIRTVKDMLRSVLLHRHLSQSRWREILPKLLFALNASESKATRCTPFEVVYGRPAVLPQDIIFNVLQPDPHDALSAASYKEEITSELQDIFDQIVKTLQLSKTKMQQRYNRNLRFTNYVAGQQVWLKKKHYKTGENRKLAPRREGPWTVFEKLPNGVNFKIINSKKEEKIVHHDRLSPVLGNAKPSRQEKPSPSSSALPNEHILRPTVDTDSSIDSESSGSEHDLDDTSESNKDNDIEAEIPIRGQPPRLRTHRTIPNAIPWDVIKL